MVQLLIVDSDHFATTGLRDFLANIPAFEVGGLLDSGQEALALAQPPEVLIVEFQNPCPTRWWKGCLRGIVPTG